MPAKRRPRQAAAARTSSQPPTAPTRQARPQTRSGGAEKLAQTLLAYLRSAQARLAALDLETPARQTGFMRRSFRKVSLLAFVQGLLALSAESVLSLERLASGIAQAAGVPYSKQALHQRLGPGLEQFVAQTAIAFLGQMAQRCVPAGLRFFQRVLLHDSTVETVPQHLAAAYPGGRNQKPQVRAALRIQFVADLLRGTVLDWRLSGFTRNDQAAAPDILTIARAGDLVIRDLGYFSLPVFAQLDRLGAFFLSRYRHGVKVFDLEGRPLDLVRELRTHGRLDCWVQLGETRQPVRLVALPVPPALANARRRHARANRDRRSPPSPTRLYLLGWTLLITNVPAEVWTAEAVGAVYRLRWRIEVIFKTWKSHLGLHRLNTRTAPLLGLTAAIKLLFCALVYRQGHDLELLDSDPRHVSLLRLARILEHCACLVAAAVLQITVEELLAHYFLRHLHYEPRSDRKNFYQYLAELDGGLG